MDRQAGTDAPAPHEEASSHSQEPDDDLADFIIDDDDDDDNNNGAGSPAGADSEGSAGPTLSRARTQGPASLMPEEFSQLDVPTSFKTYVQYLIYWICNGRRALVVSDEIARYFYLGYITVARVVDSVEQSLVASSAWVDDFRTDMYRFPEFAATPIHGVPGCEACHFRQKRTATFRVTLSGEPYSRRMLAPPRPGEAPAAADSGSSSSDADSVVSVADSGGPAMYNVGRTCKARSELCHELHHYCYRLAAQIDIALQPSSPGSADPDDLVTALEEQGTTDQLFSEFKDMLSRSKSGFAA
ncbi:hypothetical protein H4R18_000834 [Coemansia javaensis]|uniref:DUF4211 domain-containing protein n=1 Tax=Coemansia javaensis TaxID=2761396 RepID=A0A9W8HJY1_9FUNG|nr:hypothetical protein H4R18_000834 [Coemansia javaensis]